MTLNSFQPKNIAEELLLPITKHTDILSKQTQLKPKNFEIQKWETNRDIFFFIPRNLEDDWLLGVPSLEVYTSVSNITEENNKYKGFSYEEELAKWGETVFLMRRIKKNYFT